MRQIRSMLETYMTHSFSRPRETAGYSLKRRTRTWLGRIFGTQVLKSQDLRFVTINGHRFKRLILHDSYLAADIERNMEAFGESAHFSRLVTRHENEIWVEFVDGALLRSVDDDVVARMAAFYAAIYARRPRLVATDEGPFLEHVERDLRFLNQVGVLGDEAQMQLAAIAKRLLPPRVWVGFDYVDPVLKNLDRVQPDRRQLRRADAGQGGRHGPAGAQRCGVSHWPARAGRYN